MFSRTLGVAARIRFYTAWKDRLPVCTSTRNYTRKFVSHLDVALTAEADAEVDVQGRVLSQHAVISTFDLFSIGGVLQCIPRRTKPLICALAVGPSSSHTVGPMRAGKIFIKDLEGLHLLAKVRVPYLRPFISPEIMLLGPLHQDSLVSSLS